MGNTIVFNPTLKGDMITKSEHIHVCKPAPFYKKGWKVDRFSNKGSALIPSLLRLTSLSEHPQVCLAESKPCLKGEPSNLPRTRDSRVEIVSRVSSRDRVSRVSSRDRISSVSSR